MEQITSFHDLLLIIITVITLFVLALLAIVIFRFNELTQSSRTTHNTTIEVLWTVIPLVIWSRSRCHPLSCYTNRRDSKVDMTIQATGRNWWNYEYVDHGNFSFDANMIATEDLKQGQLRLLETDNRVMVFIDAIVGVQVTAADVLPPGPSPHLAGKSTRARTLNEIWFGPVKNEGVYYGQCSELCGTRRLYAYNGRGGFEREFDTWIEKARKEFAADDSHTAQICTKRNEIGIAEKSCQTHTQPTIIMPTLRVAEIHIFH